MNILEKIRRHYALPGGVQVEEYDSYSGLSNEELQARLRGLKEVMSHNRDDSRAESEALAEYSAILAEARRRLQRMKAELEALSSHVASAPLKKETPGLGGSK